MVEDFKETLKTPTSVNQLLGDQVILVICIRSFQWIQTIYSPYEKYNRQWNSEALQQCHSG